MRRGFGEAHRFMEWEKRMDHNGLDVLFIGESKQSFWHLARYLQQRGFNCTFASGMDEVRIFLGQRPVRLVLSTRPVTERGPLLELLRAPDRFVFYSVPVEDSCLWFQAIPEFLHGTYESALRPSEFMQILNDIIARISVEPSAVRMPEVAMRTAADNYGG